MNANYGCKTQIFSYSDDWHVKYLYCSFYASDDHVVKDVEVQKFAKEVSKAGDGQVRETLLLCNNWDVSPCLDM